MGGGKGGGGGGATVPPEIEEAAQNLLNIGEEQLGIGLPPLRAGGQVATDVLTTGSSESLRPAILSAVEATRSRGSQEIQQLEESLTRRGVTGTQFQEATAPARVALADEVAGIPSSFTLPIFQQATGGALEQTGAGLQSLQAGLSAGASGAVPGRQKGGVAGGLAGAASGAASGAQIGSVFPGYGTAIGAVAGGLLGGAKGSK